MLSVGDAAGAAIEKRTWQLKQLGKDIDESAS